MNSKTVIFLGILAAILLNYFCVRYHLPHLMDRNETVSFEEKSADTNESKKPMPIALKDLDEDNETEINETKSEDNITKQIRSIVSDEFSKEAKENKEENQTNDNNINDNNISVKSNFKEVEKQINEKLLSTPIEFRFSSAVLTRKSKKILKDIAKELKKLKDIEIEVAGYTDAKGNQYFNKDLSLKRAKSVRRFLIREGIDKNIITAVGYGESNFIYDKNDKRNRRVEIHIKRGK
ncbi:MAG: OmpA family protein [Epsilonproteobacteria bacterium]|nr:OmpA family protein [Campylobacterota bacterium]